MRNLALLPAILLCSCSGLLDFPEKHPVDSATDPDGDDGSTDTGVDDGSIDPDGDDGPADPDADDSSADPDGDDYLDDADGFDADADDADGFDLDTSDPEGEDAADVPPDCVDADCDDGLHCTGIESCDASGSCQPGTPVECDDSILCTVDSCDEITDSCDNDPLDADGDGHGPAAGPGGAVCGDDCDDAISSVYAGATELCDLIDQDCDAANDDGCGPLVWVANQDLDAVQVVDTAVGGGVVATIPVGDGPGQLAFTPDGGEVYVCNQTGGTVSVIDAATWAVEATIPVGMGPRSLAVTPDGTRVYVANGGSQTISVIDTTTRTVGSTLGTGPSVGPFALAMRPDGTQLWATTDGYLKVFSLPSHAAVYTSGWTDGFVSGTAQFLPDGSVLWASSGCGCCGNVQRYSGATYGQISDHRFGSPATPLAMSPDGSVVYAGYWGAIGGCSGPVMLVRMNGATGAVSTSVPFTEPWNGAVVSRDGATLYLALFFEDEVAVVDAASLSLLRTFTVGGVAGGVAVPP